MQFDARDEPPRRVPERAPGRGRERPATSGTYVYDGKSFTLFAKRVNYYATVPGPATIGELADRSTRNTASGAAVDLFRWGGPRVERDRHQGSDGLGPASSREQPVSTTLPSARARLADLDPAGRLSPPAQARDHDDEGRSAAAAHRRLHVEPGAVVRRRGVRIRSAGGARRSCSPAGATGGAAGSRRHTK